MKSIQVIDGADNCTYDIYEVSDQDFSLIFPQKGQNIEFNSDLFARLSEEDAIALNERLWVKRIEKEVVVGIHGTLFYELEHKKIYYPIKRDSEMITVI
jgi:hypothetical protein